MITYIAPDSALDPDVDPKHIELFRKIDRKARSSGRPDLILLIDRIAELRGADNLESANEAILEAISLIS